MMLFQYNSYDPRRYATKLHRSSDGTRLMWECGNGQDVLIVQTSYQCAADGKQICRTLSDGKLTVEDLRDGFQEINSGTWIRLITYAEKIQKNGCDLHGESSRYTVFACSNNDGRLDVYESDPGNNPIMPPFCDIRMKIDVGVNKKTTGRWRKKETGLYEVVFPPELKDGYVDGDLAYRIEGYEISISREAIQQGTIYIKSQSLPEIISNNRGIELH